MKKKYIILLAFILIFKPKHNYAQEKEVAAAAVLAVGIGALIASTEDATEQLELGATEWVLKNTNMRQFNIEAILSEGTKVSDISRSSFVPFKLYEFEIIDLPNGAYEFNIVSRYVLMMYAFPGFISDSGINYTKVRYELIDKEIWFNRMQGFLMAASDAESTVVDEVLQNGTILSKGATTKIKSGKNKAYSNNYEGDDLKIRFYEIDNDSYLVSEYVDDNIYLYNEESLGIFHRETERLFQVKTLSVRRITDFLRRPVKARTRSGGGLKKG